uniref:RNA-directed DNA polymerase, eukaryota n=1 Tax=Tanacetum cinerariifolium TaxID=118510 RepID=A0A699H5D1_TANCI|nr:hypothetical protein [Tanacetum cinerariifolium]
MVLPQSSQALHVKVFHKATNKTMFCSYIYAGNLQTERRLLWADLGIHGNVVHDFPWVLMGDFNMELNMEDIYAGSSPFNSAMCEFKDCVTCIEIMDINSSGLHYTWNQKLKGGCGILKKLDRIMGNVDFMDAFQEQLVECHWNSNVEGHNMFKVVSNVKALKKPLQKLLHDHGNIHEHINKLRIELDVVQKALDLNPTDSYLREEESVYLKAFNEAKLDEERIEVVVNSDNIEVSVSHVSKVFVSHYEQFLGTSMECNELNVEGLFSKSISATTSSNMVCGITNDEIKAAMFDISDDKAPGPDGAGFCLEGVHKREGCWFIPIGLVGVPQRTKPVNLYYTRDGWLVLIGVRTPRGVKTMTRSFGMLKSHYDVVWSSQYRIRWKPEGVMD